MSDVCGIEHYVMTWLFSKTVSRGLIHVFFNRHCSTLNLVKEKQGVLDHPDPTSRDDNSSSGSILPCNPRAPRAPRASVQDVKAKCVNVVRGSHVCGFHLVHDGSCIKGMKIQ